MPLAGTGSALGTALATAAGTKDEPGVAAWQAIGESLCSQLPSLGSFDPAKGSILKSVATVVEGTGKLVMASGAAMGPGLASASGA